MQPTLSFLVMTVLVVSPNVWASNDDKGTSGDDQTEASEQADPKDVKTPPPANDAKEPNDSKDAKPMVKSETSKNLENRLALGLAIGYATVKPAKGTWAGPGNSSFDGRYRWSKDSDGKLFITGSYAPIAGVWTVNGRDYNTTLHGFYGGFEYRVPTTMLGNAALKANVEVGYMLVYAKPQDSADPEGGLNAGKFNAGAGLGADWGFCSERLRIGPFLKGHAGGFSILNFGGSAQFVF